MDPIAYYNEHKSHYLDDLKTLCRIPSVSPAGHDPKYLDECAQTILSLCQKYDLNNTEILTYENTPPYVLGRIGDDPNKPTYILYAHHDVQPKGDTSKWLSEPFDAVERDGRLYGRGTSDDKAAISLYLSAIDSYQKAKGELPINIILLIEGEEEVGSPNLGKFLETHLSLLQSARGTLVADGMNHDSGLPTINISLRGIAIVEVEVRSLKNKVHSGLFSGPTPDPAMALSKLLGTLMDDTGRITVDGLYDDVAPLTEAQSAKLRELPFSDEEFRKQVGMLPNTQFMQREHHTLEALWHQPSLVVNAIQASSRAEASNIICDSAWARVGIRLVHAMDPQKTLKQLKTHLETHAPWGCEVVVTPEKGFCEAWSANMDDAVYTATLEALSEAFDVPAVAVGGGASIPILSSFGTHLAGKPLVLIGIEDPYSLAHGENESLNLVDYHKTVEGLIRLFDKLGTIT